MIQIILTTIRKSKAIPILSILVLAGALRLFALDRYPAGLNADEAAIGYNAYSLIRTGKDEHGAAWPIVFKSFGDYKPGGYFYLVLPFVKAFGLNVWAVRLPSAILGIFSVWLIYLLAGEIVKLSHFQPPSSSLHLPASIFQLFAALLLAISPWHIHFSRGGWETNAATTMLLAGVLLFLKSLRRPWFLLYAFMLFSFSMYTYQSTRLIVPVLGLGLVALFWKDIWSRRREMIVSGLVFVALLLPLVRVTLSPTGVSRFAGVGLVADVGPVWRVNELRGQHDRFGAQVRILHNKVAAYLFLFGKNYLDHFNGNFLFLLGDPIQRNRVPETGQLYLVELPLLVLGAWLLIKGGGKGVAVIFLWLAVAPLAAALTFQTPHALRAHSMVIPLTLITAAGLTWFVSLWDLPGKFLKNGLVKLLLRCHLGRVVVLGIFLIYIWSVTRYLHQYYVHYPQTYPAAWEYGFAEIAAKLGPLLPKYGRVIMTDVYDQPYIEMLFFLKYAPEVFQREVVLTPRDRFGFSTVKHFGKFDFQPIVWDEVKNLPRTLVVGTPKEIPSQARVFETVLFPNNQPAFEFADASP